MLQELGWEDLQSRRDQNRATMIYMIINYLVEIPAGQHLIATGVATRGHHQRFLPIYCSINVYKESVFTSQELEVWFLSHVWCPAPMSQYAISSKWLPKIFIWIFKAQTLSVCAYINSPPLEWSTCKYNISTIFGRCRYH